MLKKEEFIHLFTDLVNSFRVPNDITQGLEKFVCALYGNQWLSSVNEMCHKMFVKNFDNKNIVYFSLLITSKSDLELHIKRANYVAVIYKSAYRLNLVPENTRNH